MVNKRLSVIKKKARFMFTTTLSYYVMLIYLPNVKFVVSCMLKTYVIPIKLARYYS